MGGAVREGLGRGGHAALIAQGSAGRAHAGGDDVGLGSQNLAQGRRLPGRGHHAGDARPLGLGRHGLHLLGQGAHNAGGRQGVGVHGGEHGDAQRGGHLPSPFRGTLLGPALGRLHHEHAAHGVHGDHISPAGRRRAGRALHLVRDVVELQVEKHVEAAALEHLHDGRALGVVQGHADFQPLRPAGQLVGEGDGLPGVAVQRHDNAVGGGDAIEGS